MPTENLMLNAYRQTGQKGHIIACAISDARTKNHIPNFFDRINPRSSALCDPSPVK